MLDTYLEKIKRGKNGLFVKVKSSNAKLAPQRKTKRKNGRSIANGKPYIAHVAWPITSTCPTTCRFKDAGCYAQLLWIYRDMEMKTKGMTGRQVMVAVIAEIAAYINRSNRIPHDGTGRPRALRLPVSGDFIDADAAGEFARLHDLWRAKGGGPWFGSTANWKTIDRAAFGKINMFASVSTSADIKAAKSRRYGVWTTVKDHPANGKHIQVAGVTLVPCPAQTKMVASTGGGAEIKSAALLPGADEWRHLTCAECRLCIDGKLPGNRGIVFAEHGQQVTKKRNAQAALAQIGRAKENP